jgi:hypothetical protein
LVRFGPQNSELVATLILTIKMKLFFKHKTSEKTTRYESKPMTRFWAKNQKFKSKIQKFKSKIQKFKS